MIEVEVCLEMTEVRMVAAIELGIVVSPRAVSNRTLGVSTLRARLLR
jgi:hypothetical protein